MKKWVLWSLAALCAIASAQVTVTPIVQPRQTFVDASGNPCALCTLATFAAGTTTPQPTFTDSSGTTQNTNPIVLDVAGGANIWVSNTLAYKFVLTSATGTTIWTVDNVKSSGGGAIPCTNAYAIQFANSSATALACDPTITINPTSHSLNVGGTITGPAFTLKNLSTIPANWTLDVTTPTTALNSMSPIPLGNLATQGADTVDMNATGSLGVPTAVPLPGGCTNGVNYSITSHNWVCAPTTFPLTNLAPQPADTIVMNATGGTATPTAVAMPPGCANGVNYNTTAHVWACIPGFTPQSCNVNGCYVKLPDGTLIEWGQVSGCVSSNAPCNSTATFPTPFTTTTNLSVVVSCQEWGNCAATSGTPSTGAFPVTQAPFIFVGGSGGNLPGTQVVEWMAIGH